MYLGKIVEIAPRQSLYARPLHPYTRALLDAIPTPDPERESGIPTLAGDIPSPVNPPSGCRFRTRCPLAVARCGRRMPALEVFDPAQPRHQVACFRAGEARGSADPEPA